MSGVLHAATHGSREVHPAWRDGGSDTVAIRDIRPGAGAIIDVGMRTRRSAWLVGMLGTKPRSTAPRHPLEPLSKTEILRASALVEADERFVTPR